MTDSTAMEGECVFSVVLSLTALFLVDVSSLLLPASKRGISDSKETDMGATTSTVKYYRSVKISDDEFFSKVCPDEDDPLRISAMTVLARDKAGELQRYTKADVEEL